ncbi:hypothetical protein [Ornithinimicrobium kibberense]|uniref:hypothetical protein n=1 Tax=Ornithinimicrobium kibberense TaxID=282060 RepID=UPI00361036D0
MVPRLQVVDVVGGEPEVLEAHGRHSSRGGLWTTRTVMPRPLARWRRGRGQLGAARGRQGPGRWRRGHRRTAGPAGV